MHINQCFSLNKIMIMVRVIGLGNSRQVQTGANIRKLMQTKVIPICIYLHEFASICDPGCDPRP